MNFVPKFGATLAHLGVGLTLILFAAACNSSVDSVSAPPVSTTVSEVEELFEVGPMPVIVSGREEDAWMAFCAVTATGYEVELRDAPQGGYEIDLSQPGFSDERWERAIDYCTEEGYSRGHSLEPTEANFQAGFEELLAANSCLVEQGINQPEVPASFEEYLSSPWQPFGTEPMLDLLSEDEEEYNELYRLCVGDEHIAFVDWEP